jgi:hypothetical protein
MSLQLFCEYKNVQPGTVAHASKSQLLGRQIGRTKQRVIETLVSANKLGMKYMSVVPAMMEDCALKLPQTKMQDPI